MTLAPALPVRRSASAEPLSLAVAAEAVKSSRRAATSAALEGKRMLRSSTAHPPSYTKSQKNDPAVVGGLRARAGADEAALDGELAQLHGVQRGALEQVVAHDEEVEDLRVGEVAAHAADDGLVAAGVLQRRWGLLDEQVGERAQRLERLVELRLAGEGRPHGDRVPDHHRDAHTGRRH